MPGIDESNRSRVDIDALFKKDAFKSIDPEQLRVFKDFALEIEGKNSTEIAALFIQCMRRLPKGRPISGAERDALVQTISESLPEEDRKKLNNIMKILEMSR